MKKLIFFFNQDLIIHKANLKTIKFLSKIDEVNLQKIKEILNENYVNLENVSIIKFYDESLKSWVKLTNEHEKVKCKTFQIMLVEKKTHKNKRNYEEISNYLNDNFYIIPSNSKKM